MPKASISFTVTMNVQDMFFDRQKVIDNVRADDRKRLSKAGAYLRQRSKTKLRRRQAVSAPGSPPSVHSQDRVANLKNIQFAMNSDWESVVVGPVKLNMRTTDWMTLGSTTVPELQEFGGVAQIQEERWIGQSIWRRRDLRRLPSPNKEYRKRRALYRKRPWMGPSLNEEARAGTLVGLFASGGSR